MYAVWRYQTGHANLEEDDSSRRKSDGHLHSERLKRCLRHYRDAEEELDTGVISLGEVCEEDSEHANGRFHSQILQNLLNQSVLL